MVKLCMLLKSSVLKENSILKTLIELKLEKYNNKIKKT